VGLLEYEISTQTFKTTEKGLRLLEVFSELDQRAREEQQRNKNDNNSSSNAYGSKG
jgi:hypothetical protein